MLTIGGVGPGNPKYLTLDVMEAMNNAKCILGFGRIAKSLKMINKNIISINKVDEVLDYIEKEEDILLLASGDPNFFGIVQFIQNKGIKIKEILPGLSSFQYLMSKLQKPWQDAKFISLHGRKGDLDKLRKNKLSIILTDKDNNPAYIYKKLKELNIRGNMYIGFNLSHDDEEIMIKRIGEDIEDISPLAIVVIENEMD